MRRWWIANGYPGGATLGVIVTASLGILSNALTSAQTASTSAAEAPASEALTRVDDPAPAETTGPAEESSQVPAEGVSLETPDKAGRLFGVLPNASTIEAGFAFGPVTTAQTFRFATEDSFDKFVFPFVGAVAYLGVGQPQEEYWKRYVTAFADNTISNYMVTAIFPAMFRQDPRYFQLGTGSIWRRIGYSASRAVITRSRDGRSQFNVSEIGGNALSAMISNAYYPVPERSAANTLARAGSMIMWDAASFEAKEFWPDIRHMLQQMIHRH